MIKAGAHDMTQSRTLNANALAGDILDCIQEAVVYSDLSGIICGWNRGAKVVFGFSAEEALGQSVDIIIPEKLRRAHWAGFHKAVDYGDIMSPPGSRLTRALQKNGNPLYVDMSFAMVRNQDGEMTGSVAVARDATARYLAERAARLSDAGILPAA